MSQKLKDCIQGNFDVLTNFRIILADGYTVHAKYTRAQMILEDVLALNSQNSFENRCITALRLSKILRRQNSSTNELIQNIDTIHRSVISRDNAFFSLVGFCFDEIESVILQDLEIVNQDQLSELENIISQSAHYSLEGSRNSDLNRRSDNLFDLLSFSGSSFLEARRELDQLPREKNIPAIAALDADSFGAATSFDIAQREQETMFLHLAAIRGDLTTVVELLRKGAEIEAKYKDSWTPLHLAAMNGHLSVVVELVERGANLEARDQVEWTSLHYAAADGNVFLVVELLQRGADIEAREERRQTPLHRAAVGGQTLAVVELIRRGADLEARDKDLRTPLHLAAKHGQNIVLVELLQRGADIEANDLYQLRPLHWAAMVGHDSIVVELIQRGADMGAKDEELETPLHWAVMRKKNLAIKALVDAGATLTATDRFGSTPLSLAGVNREIFEIFEQYHSSINRDFPSDRSTDGTGEILSSIPDKSARRMSVRFRNLLRRPSRSK